MGQNIDMSTDIRNLIDPDDESLTEAEWLGAGDILVNGDRILECITDHDNIVEFMVRTVFGHKAVARFRKDEVVEVLS